MYVAKPADSVNAVATGWNHSEYLSAIGQEWMAALDKKVGR
jgi:hypothetical protein